MIESTLIIGIGNPLRGDDAVGWSIIDELTQHLLKANISLIKVQQLTMDLVDTLQAVDRVIFIDARHGDSPGKIQHQRIAANTSLEGNVSHYFDPGTLLAAVQALYGYHPIAELYTIVAESFEYGADLTRSVQTSASKLANRLIVDLSSQG
jgi:hydrogenase maturation protease